MLSVGHSFAWQHKCRFTAVQWDTSSQELLLGDDLGHVYFYNIATEKCLKCQKLYDDLDGSAASVRDLSIEGSELLVTTSGKVEAYQVVRDVQYSEVRAHTAPVVSMGVADAYAAAAAAAGRVGGLSELATIYSASLDNTIRAWDPYDMAQISVLISAPVSNGDGCSAALLLLALLTSASLPPLIRGAQCR